MADRKLLTLVDRLHRKTLAGQVPWTETTSQNEYAANFSGLSLSIKTLFDPDWPDKPDYVVKILNTEGRLVEEFSNVELSTLVTDAEPHPYKLLEEIYRGARRIAMGVDNALDLLLNELGGDDSE